MENTVACVCGVKIDIAGAIPRKDGTKVWCKVCGTVSLHHRTLISPLGESFLLSKLSVIFHFSSWLCREEKPQKWNDEERGEVLAELQIQVRMKLDV